MTTPDEPEWVSVHWPIAWCAIAVLAAVVVASCLHRVDGVGQGRWDGGTGDQGTVETVGPEHIVVGDRIEVATADGQTTATVEAVRPGGSGAWVTFRMSATGLAGVKVGDAVLLGLPARSMLAQLTSGWSWTS